MANIKITDQKIVSYLKDKEELINKGRDLSREIDLINKKIEEVDKKEREITEKVKPVDLISAGEALQVKINGMIEELGVIGEKIKDAKIAAIPDDMKKVHYALRAQRESLEIERNKIGLNVQKIKDRVRPLIQKYCKPFLEDDYEDIETAKLAGNVAIVKKFSHLDNFKKSFKRTNK